MPLARAQTDTEPLEGLAKSGSEACLQALRECSPARALKAAALPRCEHGLAQAFTLAPDDAAAYQRVAAALIQRRRSAPPAQGLREPAGSESPAGPEHSAEGRAISASCSAGGAAAASAEAPGTPFGTPAAPDQAPTPAHPRRPAWLEEVAQRVSQGISLGSRASHVGPRLLAPTVSFQGLLPTAYGLGEGCSAGAGDRSP